jgi:HEAT repeat protein
MWTQPTQSALIDIVFSGEDSLRALVCELLSQHDPEGHQILQELTGTDNYLARKAAIYGLVHIQEPWVNTLLEKLSIEDTQWVVRDAAKFTLEHPFSMSTFIPKKEIPVLEDPWTLQKAETYVSILPAQGLPSDLLFTILEKDTAQNKEIALHYLLTQPTPKLVKTLTSICTDEQSEFRETALNALFSLSKRGFDISTKE